VADEEQRSETAAVLNTILTEMVAKTQPEMRAVVIDPDADLIAEYGIDSITRIELLSRIEDRLHVQLPEERAIAARTVHDLLLILDDVLGTPAVAVRSQAVLTTLQSSAFSEPLHARTLTEAMAWHMETSPEQIHVYFEAAEGEVQQVSYSALHREALSFASSLREHGIKQHDRVALMLPTGVPFLASFVGCLLGGFVPVPLYPPANKAQLEQHLHRQIATLNNCGAKALITSAPVKLLARLAQMSAPQLSFVATPEELEHENNGFVPVNSKSEDIAFLQYTSGSTGNPKGVVLTHRNLLANIRAMGRASEVRTGDVIVSWLPLYHDMGLIGAWLGSLYFGFPFVLMNPLSFIAHPERWLWAIHRYRGTISGGPNFAYQLCASRLDEQKLQGLDLSSWRVAFNGAEPVSANTIREFSARFAAYGFSQTAMSPVYGLAENSVGLCFPPSGRGPRFDSVNRTVLQKQGRAEPINEDNKDALICVSSGIPIIGHHLRIVDDQGNELGQRSIGQLQFQGPSSTSGYYENSEATVKLFDGKWLNSGDYAYTVDGEVFITGRIKDMIIRGGRNIYPQDIEEAVCAVPGIRKGCVAAFATTDFQTETEKLVVVAETRERQETRLTEIKAQIHRVVAELIEVAPDDIVLVPPRSVLKTSSGKIRRSGCRELYEQGRLGKRQSTWTQLLRLTLEGAAQGTKRLLAAAANVLYAAWVYSLLAAFTALAAVLLILMRSAKQRRAAVRRLAQVCLFLCRIPICTSGLDNISTNKTQILIVNHSSYVDALILTAVLPSHPVYVAKRELLNNAFTRFFLSRLGTAFVERQSQAESIEDTKDLIRAVEEGQSLIIFPEGTFVDAPGLLPFKLGAFMVAAKTDVPLVPIGIKGTRQLLRPDYWLPKKKEVAVAVGNPILAKGPDWTDVIAARDASSAAISRLCS
jgi:1-acyl-sn-glycerol-3-phosphate acyltransferase